MNTPDSPAPKPIMLVILDGWGWRTDKADNAVLQARTPNFDRLRAQSPHAFLRTCGRDVGLPDGQMGNSEVGHLNIGAGRVVMQELPRIDTAIEDGSFARNEALQALIAKTKASGGTVHLLGLISPGGVHAHQNHVIAAAKVLAGAGLPVAIHAFLDGRDTPPESAAGYLQSFEAGLPAGARIATLIGRYYAMDRDKRWDRVQKAHDLLTDGTGTQSTGTESTGAQAAIAASYRAKVTDEFVLPAVLGDYQGMKDGDSLLAMNFRADRIRELLASLLDPAFDGFPRARQVKFAAAAGLTYYADALEPFLATLFAPQHMEALLGEVVAASGRAQLRMAETEKYPHVTYFLNGGREEPFAGEERILVPSPKVATYDLQPEMSAPELTDKAVAAIASGKFALIVLNFANPDMVGHTGSLPAAIKAVETVDTGLGRIADAIAAQGGALLVTADHGNCELMRDPETGEPHTAHTLNVVPVILHAPGVASLHDGRLADLAPTLLALLGIPQPAAMTGSSLIGGRATPAAA